MSKTRVALLGAGGMANGVHYPSLVEMDDVELVGLCDLMPDKLKATAEKFGISSTYSDYKQMIAEQDPEAVYVLMPPQHLFEPTAFALEAGKHVFIEKPPALTVTQIRNLAKKAAKHNCLTMCGFNRRFAPLIVECKKRVTERGPIEQVGVTFYKNYFAGEYYNGVIDILTCDAIHAVDLLRHLCGEVKHVASSVRCTGGEDYPNSFNALLEFESGASGVLLTIWTVGKRFHSAEFHSKGISCYTEFEVEADIWADNKNEAEHLTAVELAGTDARHHTTGFFGENRHFIDCVQDGVQPLTCFDEATKTMELVDAIYRNAF